MKGHRTTWLVLAAGITWTPAISAQSLQRFSIQGVGVYVIRRPAGSNDVRENRRHAGGEVQVRYTFAFSRVSLGVGYQESAVRTGFLEPRVVVAAAQDRAAFYVSGRAGVAQLVCAGNSVCADQKPEQLLGAGGGILVQVNRRVALDLGALYFFTYYTPVGQGNLRSRTGWGQLRAGLSAGL